MHERKRFMIGVLALGVALSPTPTARAQSQSPGRDASFVGRVESKVGAMGVAGAEVSFPALKLGVITDSAGAFRFSGLPAGVQSVRIRRLGFAEWNDTITLVPGASASRVYTLAAETPTLDTVRTREQEEKYLSPALRGFEERRLSKRGGYFIPDSVFRANENEPLTELMQSRMPGTMFESINGHRFAVSTRKQCRGPVLLHSCGNQADCFVAVYVDGLLIFNAELAHEQSPLSWPDLNSSYPANILAGAEFYPSAATAPVSMHVSDDGCGSLWLWTRER